MLSWFSLFLIVVLKIFQPGASQTLSTPIVSTTCTSVTITSEIDPFISSYIFSWNLFNGNSWETIAFVGLDGRGNVLQNIPNTDVMNRITVINFPNVLNPNNAPFNSTLVFQFDNDTTVYHFGVFAPPLNAIAPPVTKPTCNPTSSISCPYRCLCDSTAVEVCDDGFINRSGTCEADGTFSFIETCPTATTDSNKTPTPTIDSDTTPKPTIDPTTPKPTIDPTTPKPTIDSTTPKPTIDSNTSPRPEIDSNTTPTIDSTTTPTPKIDSTTTPTPSSDLTTTPTVDSNTTPIIDSNTTPTIDSNTTPTIDSTTTPTPTPTSTIDSTTTPTPSIDSTTTPTIDSNTTPTIDSNTTPTINSTMTPTIDSNTTPTIGSTMSTLQTSTESGSLYLISSFLTLFCALFIAVVNVLA